MKMAKSFALWAVLVALVSWHLSAHAFTVANYTAQEQSDIKQLVSYIAKQKPYELHTLDLTVPAFERAYLAILRGEGKTPKNTPWIFDQLKLAKTKQMALRSRGQPLPPPQPKTAPGALPDLYWVFNLTGINDWTHIGLWGQTSMYYDGTAETVSNEHIMIVDNTGGLVSENYGQGADKSATDVVISTDKSNTDLPVNNPKKLPVMGQGLIQATRNGVATGPAFYPTDWFGEPATATVLAPVHKKFPDYTVICLNRGAANEKDCDYGPFYEGWTEGVSHLLIPVQVVVTLLNDIWVDKDNVPIGPDGKHPPLRIYVTPRNTGGVCVQDVPDTQLWDAQKKYIKLLLGNNGEPIKNKAQINLNSYAGSDNADFDALCWSKPNTVYDLSIDGTFYRHGTNPTSYYPGPYSATSLVSTGVVSPIWPLHILFGCLIEGTMVTMADGQSRPVESLHDGDMVLSARGPLRVRSRTKGVDLDFVLIGDARGDQVLATPTHPFPTQRGLLEAKDLESGDVVASRNGPSLVVRVEKQHRRTAAKVYNLVLEAADGNIIKEPGEALFYANSILVGDNTLQDYVMKRAVR